MYKTDVINFNEEFTSEEEEERYLYSVWCGSCGCSNYNEIEEDF